MESIVCYDYSGTPLKNLYQWDSNQKIMISGVDVASSTEVHFCHPDSSEALVLTPYADEENIVSTIPNILLQQAKPLIVYVFQDSGESGSRTVNSVRIPVYPRPKPADYIYTETEVLCYREIDERLRALEVGGVTGGYYTPEVTQPDENTLQFSFTASSQNMPVVDPVNVTLPGNSSNDSTHYVTPQMFGAVADGETDDTVAVQTALDHGGMIYFPAGRYKVTRSLTATKSGKISMLKPYPCTNGADYPLTNDDNWMGARIETYATDGYGLLISDGVEVDGLYMRAMDTFTGVLFKFDGSIGCATYPSQIRLSHIRLDNNSIYTVPEAMFDFVPFGSYFGILDDIVIGSLRGRQFCEYGFRSIMTTTDTNWANSMRIRDLCVDLLADYPIYIEGGAKGCGNWVFESPIVQAYPYKLDDPTYIGKTGHIDLITLKNMSCPIIYNGNLYDMHAATVTGVPIRLENTDAIACFGCDEFFDAVETVMKGKFQAAADNLNISALTMSVSGVEETGANRLKLSDGTNEKTVDLPAVSISDEQLDRSIANWFDANAAPAPTVGRNKFNPMDNETVNGYYSVADGETSPRYLANTDMTTSHFIEAKTGDVIAISKAGKLMASREFYLYDAEKNWLGSMSTVESAKAKTIEVEGVAYIRINWSSGYFTYADRETAQICVTVNDDNIVYEPYKVTYVGGIGSYIILQSPDGTQFSLSVADDGTLTATPVDSGGTDTEPDTSVTWDISGRTAESATYTIPTGNRAISVDTYLLGVTHNGYWNGAAKAPTVTLSGDDFNMTVVDNAYGVGVPYKLTAGKTYRISYDADAAAGLYIVYYDDGGVYAIAETIVAPESAAGSYSQEFTAKNYAYAVLTFRGVVDVPVTFSNIVLEGVTTTQNGSGLSPTAANPLITILRNGVYSTDQSANITALAEVLAATEEEEPEKPDEPVVPDEPDVPEVTLTSISATYNGGDVPVGTAVTALTGVVVTAHYSDGTSETVSGYTLSGTVAEGSNTITVSYAGLTAAFTVTGTVQSGDDADGVTSISYIVTAEINDNDPLNGYRIRTDTAHTAYQSSKAIPAWPLIAGKTYSINVTNITGTETAQYWGLWVSTLNIVPVKGEVNAVTDTIVKNLDAWTGSATKKAYTYTAGQGEYLIINVNAHNSLRLDVEVTA